MTIPGGILDSQLATARGLTGGFSVGGPSASTNITAQPTPGQLQIALDGGAATTVSIAVAGLNSGVLIAAALQVGIRALTGLGRAATEARVIFSSTQGRYVVISGTRGVTSRAVITAGLADSIADDLLLGVAQGGSEMTGADDLDQALLLLSLGVSVIPNSFDAVARITGANSAVQGMGYVTVHDIPNVGGGGGDDYSIVAAAPTRAAKVVLAALEMTGAVAGTATLKAAGGGAALSAALTTTALGVVTALGTGTTRATTDGLVLTRTDKACAGRLVIFWTLQ